jgi:Ser/Thr protein kinase RdoA (MazF antagonist)
LSERPPAGLWGVKAELVPLVGGHRNRAFRTLGLAPDLVFKTTRRARDAIEWLLPVLDFAERSGFAVPRFVKSLGGQYVEDGWTCELFLRGKAFEAGEMAGVGLQLARFQEATREMQQRPGFCSARALLDMDAGGDIDLRRMPARVVSLCRAAWARLEERPDCVVHGDLNASNLIWAEDGRVGLVDWDECRVDAGVFDMFQVAPEGCGEAAEGAVLAWEVACSWELEPAYSREMAVKLAGMRDGT